MSSNRLLPVEAIYARVLCNLSNRAVVVVPGCKYPGVVIQGDQLMVMAGGGFFFTLEEQYDHYCTVINGCKSCLTFDYCNPPPKGWHARILCSESYRAVVHMPGREFPAAVIHGDELADLLTELRSKKANSYEYVQNRLKEIYDHLCRF